MEGTETALRWIHEARTRRHTTLKLSGLGLHDLPEELRALTGLRSLDLSDNRLTVLPSWIGSLTGLRRLDLQRNLLVELPSWLAGMPALTLLDVTGNRHLIQPPPDVVTQGTVAVLAYLKALDAAAEAPWSPPTDPALLPTPDPTRFPTPDRAPVPTPTADTALLPTTEPSAAPDTTLLPTPDPAAAPDTMLPPTPDPASGKDPVTAKAHSRRAATLPPTLLRAGAVAVAAIALAGTAAAVVVTGPADGAKSGAAAPTADRSASVGLAAPPTLPVSSTPATPSPKAATTAAGRPSGPAGIKAANVPAVPSPPQSPDPPAAPAAPPGLPDPPAPPVTLPQPPPPQYPIAPPNVDLALGRPVNATSVQQNYIPANAVDGNVDSYWESADGPSVFPQTFTIDLGTVTTVGRLELDLPQVANWNQRTQTITTRGAGDDGVFTTIVGSRGYAFDARTGDAAGVTFNPVHIRYLQLVFTANSGWPAAQLSELRVFS